MEFVQNNGSYLGQFISFSIILQETVLFKLI